jgi:hypothetical protein
MVFVAAYKTGYTGIESDVHAKDDTFGVHHDEAYYIIFNRL